MKSTSLPVGMGLAPSVKKVLSLFLSLVMLLTITAGLDFSSYANVSGDWEYEVLDDGTAEITGYNGNGGDVKIPSKLNSYTVTSIGDYVFDGCDSLISITIPNSVTSIGYGAFSWCSSLTSVTIPNSVKRIEAYTFLRCESLKNITLSNSITRIGESAFCYCSNLTSITIPNSVTSIGGGAFEYCKKLASITIPNSVKTIEAGVFIRCENLKNITLPNGITSIECNTFYFCTNLKNITIPESVITIDDAFFGCKSLTSITIPKNVKSVSAYAFDSCENLASINVDNNNKNYTSVNGVLYNKNKTEVIRYPEGKTGSSFTIPNSVTRIGDSAFSGCTKLKTITIPEKVKQISSLFSDCKSLTSIKVHKNNKNYTSVNGVLYNKKKTQLIRCPEGKSGSFAIPNTVTSIGEGAFYSCDGLTNVTIPDSVTSIGEGAFYSCDGLTNVTIPDSVTSIGGIAFDGCKKITKITIPKNVKQIGGLAFYDCVKLKDITILSKDAVIDDYAFGYIHDPSTVYDDFSGGLSELPVKGCKIRAYKNSTAEKYAKANGITFNSIVSVTLSSTSYTYNGKVKKPSVTVKDEKGKKIDKKYYTVSYSSGRKNVGKYTVTIKFKGNYSGTVKKTFTIKPKSTTISKVTAGKKAFTVKWKKQATQTTGYQIQYSTSSNFKNAKTVTVSKNKTTSKKISKLKAKKKYYVRIRTYKTVKVNGKSTKIYSGWSKAKSVKTK